MGEGRLELDDDGRVVDEPAEPIDLVIAVEPRRGVRLPRGTGVVALALLVALAAWFALQPPTEPTLAASVEGVGIAPSTTLDDPVIGLYRVDAAAAGTTVQVRGLTGPGVRASTAYADPGGRGVRVAVVPDCDAVVAPGAAYALDLDVTSDAGATAAGRLPIDGGRVDWSRAIEDRCWRRATAAGISLVSVSAAPLIDRGLVRVLAVLRNGTGRDLSLRALDVADVATLETAPSADLRAATSGAVAARVSGRCGTAGSPRSLAWSVGALRAAPRTTVTTPLDDDQQRTIARAMAVLCSSPPPTTVTLIGARAVPGSDVDLRAGGAAVDLVLRVSTGGVSIELGSDPAGATSDSRRAFSYAELPGPAQDDEVTVRWEVPCVAAPNRSLPVLARTQRLSFPSSVRLIGAVVDEALSDACRSRL